MELVPYFLQKSKRCELMNLFEVEELYLPSEFEDIMINLDDLSKCNVYLLLDMCMYFDVYDLNNCIIKVIYENEKIMDCYDDKYVPYIQKFVPMFVPIDNDESLAEFCCRCNCFYLFYNYCLSDYSWKPDEIQSCLLLNSKMDERFFIYLIELKNKIVDENKEVVIK